jgi:hypothetical protein
MLMGSQKCLFLIDLKKKKIKIVAKVEANFPSSGF